MKSLGRLLLLTGVCLLSAAESQAGNQVVALSTSLQETPRSVCSGRGQAEIEAGNLLLKSAQHYCRSEGFGWRAAVVKDLGNLDCQRCGGGAGFSCAYTKVSLECRKAEPKLSWAGWFGGKP